MNYVFRITHTYIHMHTPTVVNKIKEKEAMNLKEDKGLDMGGLGGIKGKEDMMQ